MREKWSAWQQIGRFGSLLGALLRILNNSYDLSYAITTHPWPTSCHLGTNVFISPASSPGGVNFGGATDLSPRSREFANRGEPFCFHRQMYNSRKQWASVCRSGRTIECPFLTATGFGFACPYLCNVTAFRAPFFESNNYSTAGRQAVRHGPRFGCTHGWTSVVTAYVSPDAAGSYAIFCLLVPGPGGHSTVPWALDVGFQRAENAAIMKRGRKTWQKGNGGIIKTLF